MKMIIYYPFLSSIVFILITLLISEKDKWKTRTRFIVYGLLVVVWQLTNIFWMAKISLISLFLILAINSMFYILILVCFDYSKRNSALLFSYTLLISSWISYEMLHNLWLFNFPFLNLGSFLVPFTKLIQWYSFTGYIGGSLWLLVVVVLLFECIKKTTPIKIFSILSSLIIPTCVSIYIYYSDNELSSNKIPVSILHSSTDSRNEFSNPQQISEKYLQESKKTNGEILIWPENAIKSVGHLVSLQYSGDYFAYIQSKLDKNITLITGGIIYDGEKNKYYNSVLTSSLNKSTPQIRIKEKLVPFEEYVPENIFFRILGKIIPTMDNLRFSPDLKIADLHKTKTQISFLPIVCYELVYHDYIANNCLQGANFIVVLSNESWFKDPFFSRLMSNHAQCVAIENAKPLIKCSNNGISSFINKRGDIELEFNGYSSELLNKEIKPNNEISHYSKHAFKQKVIVFLIFFALLLISILNGFKN